MKYIQPPKLAGDLQDVIDAANNELIKQMNIESEILHPNENTQSSSIAIEQLQIAAYKRHADNCFAVDLDLHLQETLFYIMMTRYQQGDPLTEFNNLLGHIGFLKWNQRVHYASKPI